MTRSVCKGHFQSSIFLKSRFSQENHRFSLCRVLVLHPHEQAATSILPRRADSSHLCWSSSHPPPELPSAVLLLCDGDGDSHDVLGISIDHHLLNRPVTRPTATKGNNSSRPSQYRPSRYSPSAPIRPLSIRSGNNNQHPFR